MITQSDGLVTMSYGRRLNNLLNLAVRCQVEIGESAGRK